MILSLKGLRGYAALWVMLFHSAVVIIPFFGFKNLDDFVSQTPFNIMPLFYGYNGVEVFFVLTGFLLFLPYAKAIHENTVFPSLKHYWKRRLLRIFPAYHLQIAILFLLSIVGIHHKAEIGDWLAHVFMLHGLYRPYSGTINGVWWTLPVEMMFYLMLPFLAVLIKRIGILAFYITVVIVLTLYRIYFFPHTAVTQLPYGIWLFCQVFGRLDLFTYGMMGALLYTRYNEALLGKSSIVGIICIFAALIVIWFFPLVVAPIGINHNWWPNFQLYAWGSIYGAVLFILVIGLCIPNRLGSLLFSNSPITYIGTISYSVYLWHIPILVFLFQNPAFQKTITKHPFSSLLLYIAITFSAASLSYFYIERPFMKK